MAKYKPREVSYNALNNEFSPLQSGGAASTATGGPAAAPPPGVSRSTDVEAAAGPLLGDGEADEEEDAAGVIMVVPESGKGSWTHIEDLDSFFTRMYKYYLKGGFLAMLVSDCFQLFQYCFVVGFLTFLVHCVDYPVLFREGGLAPGSVTFAEVLYSGSECTARVSWRWWAGVALCAAVWLVRAARTVYNLYRAYDTKLFYNGPLRIRDCELGWVSWSSVLARVREAQRELHMCIHKPQITELDIYHRILRFDNYLVAMVNKRLLPLHVSLPLLGEVPFLSRGLKYNLELALFHGPWSPWENRWQLRECYKDASRRLELAAQLRRHVTRLALLNLLLAPLVQAWQVLYFFFGYAELIKRSPGSLGLRTWSPFARLYLRHLNELDHELADRLSRAHKPATKYLGSFPSPVATAVAKNVAFLAGSVLGAVVALTLYDESVLGVEHMLTLVTALGCVLAGARAFIGEEGPAGQRSSEELLVRVLGHVHYLPASWRGRAHTRAVAAHFQQLFQFKAVYLLFELLSPLISPFVLFSLRGRSLDIVDFYRNFTVSVLGIGDVCSFAQMDVRRHGNPEWPAGRGGGAAPPPTETPRSEAEPATPQYRQGEDGKTELSLVAFSCRNPAWRVPQPSQRHYLQTVRTGVTHAANDYLTGASVLHQAQLQRTMLGSYFHQSGAPGATHPSLILSGMESDAHPCRGDAACPEGEVCPDRVETSQTEEREMSTSTLHLYDTHLHLAARTRPRHSAGLPGWRSPSSPVSPGQGGREDTPLLRKPPP